MSAKLLVSTTTWWPSVGVLASALEAAGFDVTLLCPRGHVGAEAKRFATSELDRRNPVGSLAAALARVDPVLVVPADDRTVAHLRHLYDREPGLRELIERSLGPSRSHAMLTGRAALLEAAADAGFVVPATRAIRSESDLTAALAELAPPWVLKADGAWGGEGVRIVTCRRDAVRALADLTQGPTAAMTLKRRVLNGDPMPWHERRAGLARPVSLQAFVAGRPATCALFALAGEGLGFSVVEATATCGPQGPATFLRALDRPDIVACARRLVRRLGLSGFLGFDFLIDAAGVAHLLEMNPRITAACRMRGPSHDDPVAAAAVAFGCRPRREPAAARRLFAAFPLAWLDDPMRPDLLLCREDVPWREPDMLREALRPLWPERGALAFLPARLRGLRRRLAGDVRADLRLQSFAWWQCQASLQPSPPGFPGRPAEAAAPEPATGAGIAAGG